MGTFFLVVYFIYSIHTVYGWSNFTLYPQNNLQYNVSIGSEDTFIFIKYKGYYWVSIAFGSTQPHLGVYTITYGKKKLSDPFPTIFESILNNGETTGTFLKECGTNSTGHGTEYCAKLLYANRTNGETTLLIHRKNIEGTLYTYQFSESRKYHYIQWAISGYSIVWSDSTEHTKSTRSTLIQKIDNKYQETKCDFKTIRKQNILNTGLSIALTMDFISKNYSIIQIELYSPLYQWFGITWNSHSNGDSFIYSSGYNGNNQSNISILNWYINGFETDWISIKDPLKATWNVDEININYDNNEISVIGTANMNDLDKSNINIYDNTMILLIAWANYSNQYDYYRFAYHGTQNYLIYEFDLDCHNGTVYYPPIDNDTDTNVDIKYTPKIPLAEESGIYISITLQKSTELMSIQLYGPSDVWFGVNWGDHYDGDSFLYTTGLLDEESEAYAFDYVLRGELIGSTDENYRDPQQDWTIESILIFDENNTVQISASRPLDTGDDDDIPIDFDSNIMTLWVSHGIKSANNPFQYAYHGSNYWIIEIDLIAGTVEQIDTNDVVFNNYEHALFMTIALAFIIPIGLLLTLLSIYNINNTTIILAYIFIICGVMIKLAELNGLYFNTFHSICGFILIVLITVIICFGYLLHKVTQKSAKLSIGITIFIIIVGYFQIILGLNLVFSDSLWIIIVISVVYMIVMMVVFCVTTFYAKQREKRENTKSSAFSMVPLQKVLSRDDDPDDENNTQAIISNELEHAK